MPVDPGPVDATPPTAEIGRATTPSRADVRRSGLYLLSRRPYVALLRRLLSIAALAALDVLALALGLFAVLAYKEIYYPYNWSLAQLSRADVTFGWTLPCVMILIVNAHFSIGYLDS